MTMLLGALMVVAPGAGAEDVLEPPIVREVTLCHRTNSVSNPYREITVSVDGSDGSLGSGRNDHTHHEGPAFDFNDSSGYQAPFNEDDWGDIIPMYRWGPDDTQVFPGTDNWDSAVAIADQCGPPAENPTTLTLVKTVAGNAAPTDWTFDFTGLRERVTLTDEETTSDVFEIDAGTVYEITESGTDGVLTTSCTDDASESLTGRTLSVSVASGDDAVCTFTNTFNRQPTSSITVDKTNNADGKTGFTDSEQATGPGAAVPFQVVISNTGTADLTLATLTDEWDGTAAFDLLTREGFSCLRGGSVLEDALSEGDVLPSGSVTTCTFTITNYAPAVGSKTNKVVLTTTTPNVGDEDTSTVTTPIVDNSTYSIQVDKRNDADGNGQFRNREIAKSEGEAVEFQVTIRSTGTGALTLQALTDTFDGRTVNLLDPTTGLACLGGGNALAVGTVLAAGSTTVCNFELDDYAPAAGESLVNTVAVDTDRADGVDTSEVVTAETQVLPDEETPPVTAPPVSNPPVDTPPSVKPESPKPEVKGVQTVRALPRTGDETGGLAGMGALMLAVGAAMVLGSKRQ
ncbi:MAG: LPXTG cell wall anchor domain-containing protein, partial [Acidimicrobiia bacterium]